MGTQWHVNLPNSHAIDAGILHQQISTRLKAINQQFSTYIEDSEVSRFNRFKSTEVFTVSPEIITVMTVAKKIYQESNQYFDPTLSPLIRLWGFDKTIRFNAPKATLIQKKLADIGFDKIDIKLKTHQLQKSQPQVEINLSAIAKGYAVDQIASLLDHRGIKHYLVEIGGELLAKGLNSHAKPWQVAIAKPQAGQQQIQLIIPLDNQAVATSGDYQNFFIDKGKYYSHTINPITGYPITHNLVSVTVVHPSAMWADGYATALLVLGETKGIALVKQLELKVFFIIRQKDSYTTYSTLPIR